MGVVPARPCASALLLFVLLSPLASFLGLPLSLVESGVTIGSSETRGVRRVATVGVYGFTIDGFFEALREADVRLLLDVRQRRGVRGAQYAWANAVRLQAALARAGIEYRHHRELAPTTDLRRLQYREDARLGVGKRSRVVLAPEYRRRYVAEILDRVDLGPIVETMPPKGRAAFFCVERDPEACHRSLIAERLAARYPVVVTHLRPSPG
jgi:uncharacterized protein (DUF488 family)